MLIRHQLHTHMSKLAELATGAIALIAVLDIKSGK
jgi:hypothetical protein